MLQFTFKGKNTTLKWYFSSYYVNYAYGEYKYDYGSDSYTGYFPADSEYENSYTYYSQYNPDYDYYYSYTSIVREATAPT